MKILWNIERKDGSTTRIVTEESVEPICGDGKLVKGIPVEVVSKVTTPRAAELGEQDIIVTAKEQ